MWQISEIVRAVKGVPLHVARDRFTGISTDSRTISEGQLFVPLKGPRFSGHDFINDAFSRGAAGSLCDKDKEERFGRAAGTIILVEDTNEALLDLARHRRAEIDATFIALTGSNGKTTTKELLVGMMETTFPIAYNERNYNNRIGVSQTLLGIDFSSSHSEREGEAPTGKGTAYGGCETPPEQARTEGATGSPRASVPITGSPRYVIMELGTNNKGEIAELASLVKPDMSLITNVNPSHLQGLGDIEGVFREKTDLFRATRDGGLLFINNDDVRLSTYKPDKAYKIHYFGIQKKADSSLRIRADKGLAGFDIDLRLGNEVVATSTALLGIHNLYNILAAGAVAHDAGVTAENIGRVIASFQPYAGRFRSITSAKGYTIIDDTYNANPASMEKAISTLLGLPCKGKKIAILGDMKELGEQTAYYHRELGRLLFKADITLILLVGDQIRVVRDEVKNGHALVFQESSAVLDHALKVAEKDDIILVKGSRALKMDGIVEGLL